jgi:hypothetical protein
VAIEENLVGQKSLVAEATAQNNCTQQHVANVVMPVKYHSAQPVDIQYFAAIALKIKVVSLDQNLVQNHHLALEKNDPP